MRLLLDTHYLIWLATERAKLTPAECDLIEGGEATILVSPISIWEVRIKWRKSAAHALADGLIRPAGLLRFIQASPMELATLTGADVAAELTPAPGTGDPFDEMLLVHAQQLRAQLLTRDRALKRHPLAFGA